MDKKIYLPNDEQIGKLIEDAWQTFRKEAEANGINFGNEESAAFIKDMFVGGYCAGYNDSLLIVRGQLQAIDLINDTFKPTK